MVPVTLLRSLDWLNEVNESDTVLHKAAHAGNIYEVKTILEKRDNAKFMNIKNRLGCTPLRLAATGGHVNVVEYLVKCGAEIDKVDIKHQTPLLMAVKHKHIDCVHILLKGGANPDGDKQSLCTPLYIASMDGFYAGVCELVEGGADVNLSRINIGTFLSSPLYISAIYGHLDCFRALLSAGADPDCNGPSLSGQTLYHALVHHSQDVVFAELLYESGADAKRRDNKNQLPTDINKDNATRGFILDKSKTPRSLLSSCRITIRTSVGKSRLKLLNLLPLPQCVIGFLQFYAYCER